jgi:general secretion pathway protein G
MTHKGFTLVEILIVVIILGILAAIVIPQFTEASNDARDSAVASDLQTMRGQIELFKIQHKDMLPGDDGTGTFTVADFTRHMTEKTDSDGNAGGTLGPYLQKVPSNQLAQDAVQDTIVIGNDPTQADETVSGWYFDSSTGQIYATHDTSL